MDQRTIERIIRLITKELTTLGIKVNLVYLFGSQADGAANSESDIDIAVISESFNNKDYIERAKMTYGTTFMSKYPIDLLLLSLKEWKQKEGILTNSIQAFGKKIEIPI